MFHNKGKVGDMGPLPLLSASPDVACTQLLSDQYHLLKTVN